MIHVFVDTNVWFSAFYGSINSEKIIRAHLENKLKIIISKQVLKELVSNINKKMPKAMAPLKKLMESAPPLMVDDAKIISLKIEKYVDKKDQIILQSAIDSKSELFITGNIRHFDPKKFSNIKILTPKEAISLI